MMNIGVGSIITNGLGGPAYNLLVFGPFRLYLEPYAPPTPTTTPTITPTVTPPIPTPEPSGWTGGHGGSTYITNDTDDVEETNKKYKLTFIVKFRSKTIEHTFIVDSFKKDNIIKRVGQINTLRVKFKVTWNKLKNNRFTLKWKK